MPKSSPHSRARFLRLSAVLTHPIASASHGKQSYGALQPLSINPAADVAKQTTSISISQVHTAGGGGGSSSAPPGGGT